MVIFGVTRGVRRHELEMLDHRMRPGEAELADDVGPLGLGLHPGELDAVLDLLHHDAVEAAEEIEVPPGAAEFAVGGELAGRTPPAS